MGGPAPEIAMMPDSFYERIGKLEQVVHTHEFRIHSMESERMPHRMSVIETSLPQMRAEVSRVETTCNEINTKLSSALDDIKSEVSQTQVVQRAYVLAIGAVLTLINLFPTLKDLLK